MPKYATIVILLYSMYSESHYFCLITGDEVSTVSNVLGFVGVFYVFAVFFFKFNHIKIF